MKTRKGWIQYYPIDLLIDVVLLMELRPNISYQSILEFMCVQYGVEYRH